MSTLKVNNLQVGQDSTATNNLTWFQPGSPDGTIRLGSGNAGSATSKFTFANDGTLTATTFVGNFTGKVPDWITHDGDTNTKFGFPAADTFAVETAGSERLRITSAGVVSINDSTPEAFAALQVKNHTGYNAAQFLLHGADMAQIILRDETGGSNTKCTTIRNDQGAFLIGTHNDSYGGFSEKLRITSGGQLLLGVNNAVDAEVDLQIHSATSGNGPILNLTNDTGDCRIFFGQDNSSGSANAQGQIRYNVQNNHLTAYTAGSERLRIDLSGNVNFGANKAVALPSGTGIQVYNSSAPRIKLVNDTTGNAAGDGLQIYVTGSSAIFDHKEDAEMRFYTNATEKVRIDKKGVLRIGNTVSTESTSGNTKRIALGAKGSIQGWVSGQLNGCVQLLDNYYWDGSNNKAIEGDHCAYLSLRSGSLRFGSTNSSQSAGNNVSGGIHERFRIEDTGRIDILGDGGNAGFTLSNKYGQAGFFGGMYYDGSAWVRNAIGTRKGAGMYVNTGGHIAFLTSTQASGTSATINERLRICNDGRIGIKFTGNYTMNPNSTDLVIGDGGSGRGLTLWTAAGADNQTISFQTNETLSRAEGEISYGPTNTSVTNNRNAMMFRTNSNERLRISSSGKVGIQVTDPKSLLHVYGPGDIRMGSGDTGVANIALQVEHADNYTGTHFMFEITDSAAWSFNGTHIAHGGGGSSYGLNITYIRAIAGRESGAANSGDTWRNGGHQYNSEVMTTGQIGLNPGAGSVSFVADDTPDGAGSTRSLYKISFSAAGQGTVTTWGKLQGVLTWASTSSNGIVKIKDKDGNVLWNSRP